MNYNKVQVERRCERGGADEADVRQVWGRGTDSGGAQVSRKYTVTTRDKRGYNYKIKPRNLNYVKNHKCQPQQQPARHRQ